GGANIASVLHALRRLGAEPVFTSKTTAIRSATRVILPGVGAAGAAMERLQGHGLVPTLRDLNQPVLGICLGMQLLFETTEEGNTAMLGVIPARVEKLEEDARLRVPHMGWTHICTIENHKLTQGMNGSWFYFVHSYAAPTGPWTLAATDHGQTFSAIVRQDNFYGAQFHPERSAAAGAHLLQRFLEMPA
ncbi:MAG: imidazole glycerol phosphate synthase subunit HisH, partial [Xanthomonadales bacterium]|nr:imidazole glycerol phosphate synthase subunit HisH [Xanthomonadales bacterium]